MGSDWEYVTIDEILKHYGGEIKTGPFGTVLKASEYSIDGVPLVSVGEIGFGRIEISSTTPRVSKEVTTRLPEYILKEGDIVFGRKGAVERCARVTIDQEGWFLGSDGIRVRLPITCNSQFVLYQLLTKTHREWMHQQSNGTTMASLNQSIIKRIPLTLPPLHEQHAIAHILGSLDDKIELNRKMNATLEELARAIFKSWFVDFDPVRDKAAGRQPVGMDDATAALFPDSFETVDGREVPRGWRVVTLGSDFDILMGQSPPGETYNESGEGLPFFQGRADFQFRYPSPRIYCTLPTRIAKSGDTLVSVRAPVGDINLAKETSCIGRGVASVLHKSQSHSYTYYVMQVLRNELIQFNGEGTVFGSISRRDFETIKSIAPNDNLIRHFEKTVSSIDRQIEINETENHTLAKLRDSLLPKLLSGEIRVRDAEHWIETVS